MIKDIKKIYLGILVYDIIGSVLLLISSKASLATVGGLVAGSVVSMIALLMLAKNIMDIVDKNKGKAMFAAVFGYLIRFSLYAAILVYAAITKNINVFTVAAGLLSTNIVIKMQELVLKKTH